jgi:hypothetical protein
MATSYMSRPAPARCCAGGWLGVVLEDGLTDGLGTETACDADESASVSWEYAAVPESRVNAIVPASIQLIRDFTGVS